MGEVKDKVIIVTGSSRGIGKAIVGVLAREGAKVVVSSIEIDLTDSIVEILEGGKDRHLSLYLDVTDYKSREDGIQAVLKRYGRIDGIVNNAGINFVKDFKDTTWEDWNKVLTMDLSAVFHLCKMVIEQMMKQGDGGSIVNISTNHTKATLPGSAPYAAAKGGINMFTKGIAIEYAKHGIRANCVAPGLIKTEMWKDIVADFGGDEEACLKYWKQNIPSGRIMEPKEIAEVVSFVMSDRSSGMVGSIIYVDGGTSSQLIAQRD